MKRELTKQQIIEQSIMSRYRKGIWSKFLEAIEEYKLIADGDRIAVCISGGKDSVLLAKLFQAYARQNNNIEVKFLVADPGYSKEHLRIVEDNLKILGIPAHITKSDIFEKLKDTKETPCFMCARMRRGVLYKEAENLGCNKIALGHHFNDVIETILMGMLYGSQIQTMMPVIRSKRHAGMTLIRPMYHIREKDIINWKEYNELEFINCACPLSRREGKDSKRAEIKQLINQLKKINPNVDINIFKSVTNVNIDTILGYHNEDRSIDVNVLSTKNKNLDWR